MLKKILICHLYSVYLYNDIKKQTNMELYKVTGKETEEELNAIYLQILEDYYEYGTCSVIEQSKLN